MVKIQTPRSRNIEDARLEGSMAKAYRTISNLIRVPSNIDIAALKGVMFGGYGVKEARKDASMAIPSARLSMPRRLPPKGPDTRVVYPTRNKKQNRTK